MTHRAATGQAAHTGGERPEDGRAAPGRENGREAPPRAAHEAPGPDLPNPPSSLSLRGCAPVSSERPSVS
jgi:hypothetical protein